MKISNFFNGRSGKPSMMRLCLLLTLLFVFVPKIYVGIDTKIIQDLSKNEVTVLAILVGGKMGQRYFESESNKEKVVL